MAALTSERDTPRRPHDSPYVFPQKTNTKIWNGGMVNLDATGFAVPAADTANHKCQGRANATRDTTAAGPDGVLADGAVGAIQGTGVEVDPDQFEFDNPAGANQLTQADVGRLGYVLTDHEVIRAAGTVNSVIAGKVMAVDVVANKAVINFRIKAI